MAGFNGSDGFDYTVGDGNGGTDTGHVAVTVSASNLPPIAVDDSANVSEDGSVDVDVLANDSDPDGGGLTIASVGAAAHGTTSLNGNGTVHYVPAANYNGPDAFGYTIKDSVGFTDSATVSVTVDAGERPPTAVDDSVTINEDTPRDQRPSPTTATSTATRSRRSADRRRAARDRRDQRQRHAPVHAAAGLYGTDTFSYTVSRRPRRDGVGHRDRSPSPRSTTRRPRSPRATRRTTRRRSRLNLTGADIETCDLSSDRHPPAHGTLGRISNKICVTLLPPYSDGATVKYTPASGWSGVDTFTYRVRDGVLWSAPATVTVTTNAPVLLHVGDLDGKTIVNTSTRYTINITVTVHNATEGLVSGVTVTGNWSGGTTGGVSCKTTATGTCVLAKGNILRTAGKVTLTIAGLALSPTGVYKPTANHDPEADSNGTVIVITAP